MPKFRFIRKTSRFCKIFGFLAWSGIALFFPVAASNSQTPSLQNEDIAWVGEMIFANECNRRISCLTAWNAGEDFPSLGIGHFIWYQAGQDEIYAETFPDLIRFMDDMGVATPGWLIEARLESPWPDRNAFENDFDSVRMNDLRRFLQEHVSEQTAFIISRFEMALTTMLDSVSTGDEVTRNTLATNFYAVANSGPPYGLYALIDYVNFKGTGVSAQERYLGQGWGLKQVLLGMEGVHENNRDKDPLAGFVMSARRVLGTRVDNAPPERNESRWLTGWHNRLDTYLPEEKVLLPE